jgi:putative endonuclease
MTYQKRLGNAGELIAEEYLTRQGFQILEKNFNSRYGEIDLVAIDLNCVVFIEVKTRTSTEFGNPEDSISPSKLLKLENAALLWMEAHPEAPDDWRIDVIAILLDHQKNVKDLRHFKVSD